MTLINPKKEGVLLGMGKLTEEQLEIINQDTEMRKGYMRNMPKDVSNKMELTPDGEAVVYDYRITYTTSTGKTYTTEIGGVSDAHAWEEASYVDNWPDELIETDDDVVITSVVKMLPTGQIL